MFIADAQVHIWGPNTPERPWRAGRKPVTERFAPLTAEELLGLMDGAGVSRAVLVPPGFDLDRNDLILDAARRFPDRFGAMGRLVLEEPGARERISSWCKQPGMLGMRFSFNRPQLIPPLTEGRIEWLWEEAEKAGVPVMVLVPHALIGVMDKIAERHPGLKLTLCHLALPTEKRDAEAFAEFDKLLPIARRSNVMVKASGLPSYTSEAYPFRGLHAPLRRVYDAFGPRRIFWGTDFSRLSCTYREAVTMVTGEIPWLTADDKEWIMGRGLCEWLGWKLPTAVSLP